MPLTVYGASDDLIEVEGDIVEEYTGSQVDEDEGTYVYVSTGDVLRFRLESEGWRAHVVIDVSNPTVSKRADYPDDDEVTIAPVVSWAVVCPFAPTYTRARR